MDQVNFLDPIFKPRSIAVIGASTQVEKWGHRMIARPLKTGFRGTVYPVNPNSPEWPALDLLQKSGIPFYASQDESARAMNALVRYARILKIYRTGKPVSESR
jgi:acyl-CoA synthetase (NDP forming)